MTEATMVGAPDEVVTNAILRMVSLTPFGHNGELALITLDNGSDHTRPNTFGAASLQSLSSAIDEATKSNVVAIAVSLIQAYVFCLLTCIYLNDSVHLH